MFNVVNECSRCHKQLMSPKRNEF